MSEQLSFIEKQFPVSKISKESFKERKANYGQTLTGLGKWWGRKPLILVRAVIIGCLMPSTDDPIKDMDIFCKILSIDNSGLLLRKDRTIPIADLYSKISSDKELQKKYLAYFKLNGSKIKLEKGAPREEIELAVFSSYGYDEKLALAKRPEQLQALDKETWDEINHHLSTHADSIVSLVEELSEKKYGHKINVGDCFCGGGSIPFEAARIGCNVFGADLNPVAGVLTWADLNICGATQGEVEELKIFMKGVYDFVDEIVKEQGIETNEKGDRAISYIYCTEIKCPECGVVIPVAPSWIIGKGSKTVVNWKRKGDRFEPIIKMNASDSEMNEAAKGTVTSRGIQCKCCGKITPVSVIRHDTFDDRGNVVYGLRRWGKNEFKPRETDVFQERLYAIRYEDSEGKRYYRAPVNKDFENERKINDYISKIIVEWQKNGLIPSMMIENGYNTSQLIRERGWSYWHQLFTARQLYLHGLYIDTVLKKAQNKREIVAGLLGINKLYNWDSKLCQWNSGASQEGSSQTFMNQALNTMWNWTGRGNKLYAKSWFYDINNYPIEDKGEVILSDAVDVDKKVDLWITDPPYADAVNYHELSEFFISGDAVLLKKAFPEWYADSKRIFAVRGDEQFSSTMIKIYSNLTQHMTDNGMQVVMFTHSDPAVWAQLAIIMWKAGLKVTAAWNIATETEAVGLKRGNYVKGTVILVLRKQNVDDIAFLDEINVDIRNEVKRQIDSMQKLDDKEEPNFSDPDYVLAAYAASLKVLTSYASIEDLDLDYELNQAISNPSKSKIVTIIEDAKRVAYDCVIPFELDNYLWRELTNAEKFYIKGIESEMQGVYQISTYQEFARGFAVAGYRQMMASEKANTARLKTPIEMAERIIGEVPDFEHSIMRTIFEGIYVGVKENKDPNKALGFIKSEIPDYWDKREMIKNILKFMVNIKDISNMHPHWTESAEMIELLLTLVEHDSI